MFVPNNFGLWSVSNSTDLYAKPLYSSAVRVPCAVVHLQDIMSKTPVRSDSSATRGNAEEEAAAAKILFPANVNIKLGDRFAIAGLTLECSKVEQRFDVTGKIDHREVDFEQVIV